MENHVTDAQPDSTAPARQKARFDWGTGTALVTTPSGTSDETSAVPEIVVAPRVLTTPTPAAKVEPKWRSNVRDRAAIVTRFQVPLREMLARDANEGDTRLIVTDVLTEILGYDKFADLTTEFMTRGEFADYGLRIDGKLTAFVEVKRIGLKLSPKHLLQVERYSAQEGIEWAILTNGIDWKVWHLSAGLPVHVDLVLEFSLLSDDVKALIDSLIYVAKESLRRNELIETWERLAATTPAILLDVLFSETVIVEIRRELKRQTGRYLAVEDIAQIVRNGVIDPKLLA
jgi:hypothetical protein